MLILLLTGRKKSWSINSQTVSMLPKLEPKKSSKNCLTLLTSDSIALTMVLYKKPSVELKKPCETQAQVVHLLRKPSALVWIRLPNSKNSRDRLRALRRLCRAIWMFWNELSQTIFDRSRYRLKPRLPSKLKHWTRPKKNWPVWNQRKQRMKKRRRAGWLSWLTWPMVRLVSLSSCRLPRSWLVSWLVCRHLAEIYSWIRFSSRIFQKQEFGLQVLTRLLLIAKISILGIMP